MKQLICLLTLIVTVAGCATLSMQQLTDITRETGEEKIFNYVYKRVFEASEQAILNTTVHMEIRESNPEKGYIFVKTYSPILENRGLGPQIIVVVEKIDENKTAVKIRKYRDMGMSVFYERYFREVERLIEK